MTLGDLLSVEGPKRSTRYSQDGVKYRTLCKCCNTKKLGSRYDPTLVALSKVVSAYVQSALHLPNSMQIETKPNRLVRSIVGHLLALGVGEHRNGKAIERLTDYFLDETIAFPEEVKLYYWLYPYNDQVTIKNSAGISLDMNSFAVIMLLKFFPISFLLVIDEPPTWHIPVRRLNSMLSTDIDVDATILVDFIGLPPRRWPEAPSKTGIVMHGDGATGAIPRKT